MYATLLASLLATVSNTKHGCDHLPKSVQQALLYGLVQWMQSGVLINDRNA